MGNNATTAVTDNKAQNTAAAPEGMEIKSDKVRTPGWKLFDVIVHWGINLVGNIAGGMWTAHQLTNYKINKNIDKGEPGYTQNDRRKLAFENINIPGSKIVTGEKLNFYKLVDWFDEKVSKKIWANANKAIGNRMDEGTQKTAQEITTDVLLLSTPGHLTTAATQIFENSYIKPKLVRWLDENVTDPIRKMMGKGPTEQELAERDTIYKEKLDGELAGKSFIGVWGARAFAIGTIITSLFTLRQVDKYTVGKETDPQYLGLKRLKQGVLWAADKLDDHKIYTAPFLDTNAPEAKKFYAREMSKMAATEIVGSSMTAGMQYLYLMAREFFGFGPKTGLEKRDAAPKPETVAATQPVTPTITYGQDNAPEAAVNPVRYSEKNRPAGENYTEKANARETNQTIMQPL